MGAYCGTELCHYGQENGALPVHEQELCDRLTTILGQAGAAGAFEQSPCPFTVLHSLEDVDGQEAGAASTKATIRNRTGVSFMDPGTIID